MEKEPHVVVIGAINLDIKGRPYKVLRPHTSNPGRIEISPGGVGRNIAENLVRLGIKTTLISAISTDPFSKFVKEEMESAGVNFNNVLITDKHTSGLFVAFMDHRGDLESAIADMSILSTITPDFLKPRESIIKTADYVVMDADIPAESMDYILNLCRSCGIISCVEPVSVEKAELMIPFLDRITMVTPNRDEAEVLAGMSIEGAKGVIEAGAAILDKGVKYVIITLGAEGVYVASHEMNRFISSISTVVEDSVGAGDALVSGTIYGLCSGKNMYEAIRTGIACATLTLTTEKAVHPHLSKDSLEQILTQKHW